jgi:hypothetical protein
VAYAQSTFTRPSSAVRPAASAVARANAKNSSSRSKPTAWRGDYCRGLTASEKSGSYSRKSAAVRYRRPSVFDKAVIVQHGDPGIPTAAGRLFTEGGCEFVGVCVRRRLSGERA